MTKKELYESKLRELEVVIENSETVSYDVETLYKLYKALIEKDQFSKKGIAEPVVLKQLIRSYRYVPNSYLNLYDVERIVISGLFVEDEVYIIPEHMIRKVMRDNRGAILRPENYGLLPGSLVNYGTIKFYNGYAVALMRNTWSDGWIEYTTQYDYVTLT